MPPMLIFHGDADRIVPHAQSARLRHALVERANACELITVPRGTHNFGSEMPAWQEKIRERIEGFLREQGVLPIIRG
jgi:dipeptidyl aminopeptidase/acylaminoacyl peptidase